MSPTAPAASAPEHRASSRASVAWGLPCCAISSPAGAQTPLLPYVVHTLPQGAIVRTAYPGTSSVATSTTLDVVPHHLIRALSSFITLEARKTSLVERKPDKPVTSTRQLQSAWMHHRNVWLKRGLISQADAELVALVESKVSDN